MKSKRSRKKTFQKAHNAEKNAKVSRRIQLVMFILIDGNERVGSSKAAEDVQTLGLQVDKALQGRGPGRGSKTCPRSGRPPKVHPGIMKKVRRMAGVSCQDIARIGSLDHIHLVGYFRRDPKMDGPVPAEIVGMDQTRHDFEIWCAVSPHDVVTCRVVSAGYCGPDPFFIHTSGLNVDSGYHLDVAHYTMACIMASVVWVRMIRVRRALPHVAFMAAYTASAMLRFVVPAVKLLLAVLVHLHHHLPRVTPLGFARECSTLGGQRGSFRGPRGLVHSFLDR